MNIVLKVTLPISSVDIIAEILLSSEKHPYHELLKNMDTEEDIREYLKKGFDEYSINSIIGVLEALKIVKNGVVVEKELVEREYGKYNLQYVSHKLFTDYLLFLKRVKPKQSNQENEETNLIDRFKGGWKTLIESEFKSFEIIKIEPVTSKQSSRDSVDLILEIDANFENNTVNSLWYFDGKLENKQIDKKRNSIKIDLSNVIKIFDGNWNKDYNRLIYEFKDGVDPEIFYSDFELKNKEISYGYFDKINLKKVPLMPFDEVNAVKWLSALFKKVNLKDRYYSKSDLMDDWSNLKEETKAFDKYDCHFNYDKLIESVEKYSKDYWHLKALSDLDPFNINGTIEKDVYYLEKEKNQDVLSWLEEKISLKKGDSIIIIDRYANKNSDILMALEKHFNISIIDDSTQHDRYWFINENEKECWQVGGSLNSFLNCKKGFITVKNKTTFSKHDNYSSRKIFREHIKKEN
ncbi:hypothetical protein JXR93_01590 [bacterium]|nr:hypothetical protein [bacterium]